ncbi:MAG: hypothetical protein ACLQBJ_11250 [Bryobacteraceae bacterium]
MRTLLVFVISSLCGIMTASLGAQSLPTRFNVPFEFAVGGKTLPAGEYEVVLGSNRNGLVEIQSADGHSTLFTMTHGGAASASSEKPALVFHRYGNQYFLEQFSTGEGQAPVLELPSTKAEREAVKIASSRQVETVTLVATR